MKPYQFWQLLGFVFLSHVVDYKVNAILGMLALLISFFVACLTMKEQTSPDLDDLIGTNDGDGENECQRCHSIYTLLDGELRTKYCDHCAHEIIEDNDL